MITFGLDCKSESRHGLSLGAAYGLTALGLVAIHRGSGVVNFANAALGFCGADACWAPTAPARRRRC
jgi:branched-subunit amino acid ABC-type transport system permease component